MNKEFEQFYFDAVVGNWHGSNNPTKNYNKDDYYECADSVRYNVKAMFENDMRVGMGPHYPCLENFVSVARMSDNPRTDLIINLDHDSVMSPSSQKNSFF